jgi:hypothetical protein
MSGKGREEKEVLSREREREVNEIEGKKNVGMNLVIVKDPSTKKYLSNMGNKCVYCI